MLRKLRRMWLWPGAWLTMCFAGLLICALLDWRARAAIQDLTVTPSFTAENAITPCEPIELRLSRPLQSSEGRLAVLIGQTDLTSLFVAAEDSVRYNSATIPLPMGQTEVAVYLVAPDDEWTEIARFPLHVASMPEASTAPAPAGVAQAEAKRRFGFDKFEIAPSLNLGLKSQFAETHFPEANRPARPAFNDATIQGSLKTEMSRGDFQAQSQFDLVGSSARNEALRFAALGEGAPKVDLASYQLQLQHGSRRFLAGHSTFGAHRHLVNNFASRGLALTVPLGGRADVSLAAMNTTNIVGWDNFSGLANRRHRMFGGVLSFEVFKTRPGGLRFEAGALDAWFQPRTNFNQGNINDAERSQGLSARVLAKDKSERARLDAGFTRSRFVNANDPLLDQGASVVPARQVTRSARYADASFDLLKEFAFERVEVAPTEEAVQDAQDVQAVGESKRFNLTLNVRHERVDPLFKSIGAATQADLNQNLVELAGSFGELNFTAAHTRFNDNLAGIQTILRTGTRRDSFAANAPLHGLFSSHTIAQPNAFFPRIGYTYERVRARADFIPIGGGFDQPGAIPDQANVIQSFVAEWQFKEMRLGYRLNHSLQDNRAAGRERADLQNLIHNATFGWTPMATLNLDVEVNFEDANNREQAALDRTLRFGFIANWQATSRQSLNATFSTIGAAVSAGSFAERAPTSNSRNLELDLQWNYRLARESENRFRKFQAIYFIRYSNRFARVRNVAESVNALTKLRTFNTGVNFIFF